MSDARDALLTTLRHQFGRQWTLLRDALDTLTDEEWRRDEGVLTPARILLHFLKSHEFYLAETPDDWGDRSTHRYDEQTCPLDQLPSRTETRDYLETLIAHTDAWLTAHADKLLEEQPAFPWTGRHYLDRVIYLQRHTQQHVGELNAVLRRWDRPRIPWR